MKALIFDPYSGASGDMIMGCLLELGADLSAVKAAVQSVGCDLKIAKAERGHISGTRAQVISDKRYQGLVEARAILQESCLEGAALERALKIMDILAQAEGRVHGIAKENARFHEIGAMDALADIAGSSAALQSLEVDEVLSLPVSVGGGTVQAAHGLLPVPGPAALEILCSYKIPWKGGPVNQELLTPTGAAILAGFVDQFLDEHPMMRAKSVGYGAGKRELEMPNFLRAILGYHHKENHQGDQVVQLETNVDDVTGEVLGNLVELLIDGGALDASIIPAVMKKGRPGAVVRAIAKKSDIENIAGMMMAETGSLGVRIFPSLHRFTAERESISLEVELDERAFSVSFKVSRDRGRVLNVKPEYEDCKKIASEVGLPLRMVIKKAEEAGWRVLGG
jgi:pyridinium-3,5-bisthiocarboxylic acid mononucleotide nickel chelatase